MFSFKHYLFLFQELNKTLTVLEHYVPRYFKGAFDVYWSKLKNKINDLIVSFSCHQYFNFKLLKHQILFVSTLLASLLLVTFFHFQMKSTFSQKLTETFTNLRWQKKPKILFGKILPGSWNFSIFVNKDFTNNIWRSISTRELNIIERDA